MVWITKSTSVVLEGSSQGHSKRTRFVTKYYKSTSQSCLYIALLVLVVQCTYMISVVEAAERFENTPICLVPESREMRCRRDHAWELHCQDRTLCRSNSSQVLEGAHDTFSCSDEDVAKRAGHLCKGFPFYNGGYPVTPLIWDTEQEWYQCMTSNPNKDYCDKWMTTEDSPDEWEVGSCACKEERVSASPYSNRTYCHRWSCEQIEVDKCKYGEQYIEPGSARWYSGWHWGRRRRRGRWYGYHHDDNYYNGAQRKTWVQRRFPGVEITLSGTWDYFPYQCYHCGDNGCHVKGPEVEEEKSDCECRLEEMGICLRWYCREYDDGGFSDVEDEYYTATELHTSGNYVQQWIGDIDSKSEFEFSRCECQIQSSNGKYCDRWKCYERGMAYMYPNVFWVLLHVPVFLFISAFPIVVIEGCKAEQGNKIWNWGYIGVFGLYVGSGIGFAILGGVMEVIMFHVIMIILIGTFFFCTPKAKKATIKKQLSTKMTSFRMRSRRNRNKKEQQKVELVEQESHHHHENNNKKNTYAAPHTTQYQHQSNYPSNQPQSMYPPPVNQQQQQQGVVYGAPIYPPVSSNVGGSGGQNNAPMV